MKVAVFQGAAQLKLDGKGRMVIPSKYRDALACACDGQLVVTADVEPCLLLYPQAEWEVVRDKLVKFSAFNPKIRALQRRLIGYAEEVNMDASGRVLISPVLRHYAAIEKQVMLVGQGHKFELWQHERWQALQEEELSFMDGDLPAELEGFSL